MSEHSSSRAGPGSSADRRMPAWRIARRAVSVVFFLQGLVIGSWSLHVPFLMSRLDITESAMGLVIVMFGLGSLSAMGIAGALLPRIGSRRLAQWSVAATSLFVPALALSPDYGTTLIVAAIVASFASVAGVAMNAQGVFVEAQSGRSLMSSFHAFWSMGILVGSFAGGALADAVGPLVHAAIVAALVLGGSALTWRRLVDDRAAADPGGDDDREDTRFRLPRTPTVWILGFVVFSAFTLDGAAIDWSAVLMRDEIGAPVWLWGWPLAALHGVMMVLRFAGDGIRDRYGARALLRWGGIVGAVGFAMTGAAGMAVLHGMPMTLGVALAVGGFALAGLGLANVIPVSLSLAGRVPGAHPGAALTVVTAHGNLGILFMPASIGWAGEHFGFGAVFVGIAALPFAVAMLAASASRHDDARRADEVAAGEPS